MFGVLGKLVNLSLETLRNFVMQPPRARQ